MSAVARVAHIKNPLTIIAMFAVIAEVSGTVILPFLLPQVQGIYVWYLMAFPIVLCICFFVFLWCKPTALYAPGDYSDERNFMDVIRPGTKAELALKEKQDLIDELTAELATARSEPKTVAGPAMADEKRDAVGSREEANVAAEADSSIDSAAKPSSKTTGSVNQHTAKDEISEYALALTSRLAAIQLRDETILKALATKYGPLQRGMAIKDTVLDGVGGSASHPTIVEVIDVRGKSPTGALVMNAIAKLRRAADALLLRDAHRVTMVLALYGSDTETNNVMMRLGNFNDLPTGLKLDIVPIPAPSP